MKTKITFICCLVCMTALCSQAQDVIVKNDQDTIFCKILDVNDETIRYRIQSGDFQTTNTMNRKYVAFYQINENEGLQEPVDADANEKKSALRIALGGGYAGSIGEVQKTSDPKLNQLNEDLVKGYNIEADIEYYINYTKKDVLNFGAALHFNYMHHQTAGSDLNIPNYGHVNRYKESQIACYIAPAFVMRYDLTKWLFTSSIGLGPLFFTNLATADVTTDTGKTVTLGSHLGVEADYKISPNWGIGVRLATAGGSIRSINVNGITTKLVKPMSASSWTISGILSFRTK